MRQRSLFTSHSYHSLNEDTSFQHFVDIPKYRYCDIPPTESWTNNLAQSTSMMSLVSTATTAPLWRPRSSQIPVPFGYFSDNDTINGGVRSFHENVQDADAVVTPHGTICLRLPYNVRVDLTVDRAIRIINFKTNIILALSENGSSSALLHPNGRIYQYGSRVEVLAYDPSGNNNKYAKMWYKGVSFTSQQSALVYLVDSAGTRTTTDSFTDLNQDFSLSVFYTNSRHGFHCMPEAMAILENVQFWETEGVSNWIINNIRISQTMDGLVRIARNRNKYLMRSSPVSGNASLTTPFLHATASLGHTSHLFVRRGERRMHFDCSSFVVRNAGHSAGFNDKDQLKVF